MPNALSYFGSGSTMGDWRNRINQNRLRPPTPQPRVPVPGTALTTRAPLPTIGNAGTAGGNAFDNFYGTPMYQVPYEEGLDAVRASYAGRNQYFSGAAMKGISDYGANHAAGAMRDWIGYLGNQQQVGLNAVGAQTGSGDAFADAITRLNSNYGNALSGAYSGFANNMSGAAANLANQQGQGAVNTGQIISNGAVANANNTTGMWGGIGNALSGFAGYMAYAPYGGSQYAATSPTSSYYPS